jgi:hypothetical protein
MISNFELEREPKFLKSRAGAANKSSGSAIWYTCKNDAPGLYLNSLSCNYKIIEGRSSKEQVKS